MNLRIVVLLSTAPQKFLTHGWCLSFRFFVACSLQITSGYAPRTRLEPERNPRRRWVRNFCGAVLSLCLVAGLAHSGEVALPAIFSDHMVLQSDMAAPIFGTAAAG